MQVVHVQEHGTKQIYKFGCFHSLQFHHQGGRASKIKLLLRREIMSIYERSLYDKTLYFRGGNLLALQRSVHFGRSLLTSVDSVSFTYGILKKALRDGGLPL